MNRIPEFPRFCEVSLDLVDPVAPLLRAMGPDISELTFSNLYLFRRAHQYRLSQQDGLILVVGMGYDRVPYAFPPLGEGDIAGGARILSEYLAQAGARPVLFPLPKPWVERYFGGPSWRALGDRNNFDYVYLREELAHLPGKKFHNRRNRLLKFLREEAQGYEYSDLAAQDEEECLQLAEGWCDIRCSVERPSTFLETEAAKEALIHREALGLKGGVIRLAGRVRAFCLGEELTPETFVVHFEKTEPGREGLAQLINRDFCLHSLGGYRYVNREQDLGDPGLRQAKESYNPVFLAEKYRVEAVS